MKLIKSTAARAKKLGTSLGGTGRQKIGGAVATTSKLRSAKVPGGGGRRFGFTARKR